MALSKTQVQQIIKLKLEDEINRSEGVKGKSNCAIAEEVIGSRSSESSVRRVWKDFKKSGSYRGIVAVSAEIEDTFPECVINTKKDSVVEDGVSEAVLNGLCDSEDFNVANLAKRLRGAQRSNNQLRKIQRELFDSGNEVQPKTLVDILEEVSNNINDAVPVVMRKVRTGGKHITAEILLSDIQYGKLMHGYNTEVAVARVKEYTTRVIERIEDYISKGFVFDKIILAIIGDVIESDKKHDNSGRACDSGTAEQMKTAIENLFLDMIEPLALLGIPMDVVSLTGNHDHDGHGLNMYLPGSQHLSWPLYHSLRMLTEAKGYTHVTHEIPDGCYAIKDIYGANTLYEHGVKVSASEAAMTKRVTQRGAQIKKHIEYFRMGDKHTITRFSNDSKVVNGAFFATCDDVGGGEYSAISGYASEPAQITLFHTPRADNRSSVCDSLVVQLGHITKEGLGGRIK